MKRREFIQFSGINALGCMVRPSMLGFTQGELNNKNSVKKVHLIFMTHLDVGFTNLAGSVVKMYMNEFIPKALSLSESLRKHEQVDHYIWTTGSWLIYEFLEKAEPAMRRQMEKAIERGDILWHGSPFTTHSELADSSLFDLGMQLSKRLDMRFGKKTIAAKMTDVPGHTRGIVSILAKNDIKFLHIGVNSASTPPDIPPLFVWRNSDGSEIDVMYAKGYGNQLIIPGTQIAVDIRFTNDNHGPHKLEQITEIYKELRNQFPDAEIKASTFCDVAKEVALIHKKLPVVTQEIGDTWIHGAGSDPLKISKFRELSRLRVKWLNEKNLQFGDETDLAFGIPLLMMAEHTWGLDVKTYLKDWDKYSTGAFKAARNKPNFKLMEQSWQEKRDYIDEAIRNLPEDKQVEAQEKIEKLTPQNNKSKYKTMVDFDKNLTTHFFELSIDSKSGNIQKFKDKLTGIDWAGEHHSLWQFSYQTFSENDYKRFQDQYLVKKVQWAFQDFGKPGLEDTNAQSGVWLPSLIRAYQKINDSGESLLLELAIKDEQGNLIGGSPEKIIVELFFPNYRKEVHVTLKWFNKPAYRLPETSWFSFVPAVKNGEWIIDKMGFPVNYRDIVKNGNRKMHAASENVFLNGGELECSVLSLDAPLVALGEMTLLNFDNKLPEVAEGVHFCLHNNVWGTNFRMWFEDNMQYRFIFDLSKM